MLNTTNKGIFKISVFILGSLLFTTACKKDPVIKPVDPPTTIAGTREELTKDSIFLYAKQTYYWNDVLPTAAVFNARKFADYENELLAIKTFKGYSLSDPTKLFDKYSFLDDGSVSSELGGVAGDYGFSANFNNDDLNDLRIRYVNRNSPAEAQKVKRGQRIIKINGNTTINWDNRSFLNAAIFGTNPSITMTLRNLDGTTMDVTVNRGTYSLNPVLFTNVYTVGSKKIGYVVFNSFTTNATPKLDEVFASFSSEGISEVIVDLRYNGGGSVSTAEDLTNLIAPLSANGGLMYTTYWTKTMQDGQATILKNQKFWDEGTDGIYRWYSMFDYNYKPTGANVARFEKRGSVNNLTRAYFIVTRSTASASELVINNLKPVMDVKIVGRKTYGKPVGFFKIDIDQLDLYIPQFETKNSRNEGGYFDGIAVDKDDFDDVSKDFGDPSERLLANALSFAEKGAFLSVNPSRDRISSVGPMVKQDVERINADLNKNDFKGMVENRLKLKVKQ